jgi:hypothetical protein
MPDENTDSKQQNEQSKQQEKDSTSQEHPSRDTDTDIETFRRSTDSGKLKK